MISFFTWPPSQHCGPRGRHQRHLPLVGLFYGHTSFFVSIGLQITVWNYRDYWPQIGHELLPAWAEWPRWDSWLAAPTFSNPLAALSGYSTQTSLAMMHLVVWSLWMVGLVCAIEVSQILLMTRLGRHLCCQYLFHYFDPRFHVHIHLQMKKDD